MTFQRARSEEQREARRRAILETAASMLDEMPVGEVSLNGLSRRVGLAKSNVLRYFESREAVLLELLDASLQEWLAGLSDELAAGIEAEAPLEVRAEQLADVLSRTLSDRPVLCDLFAAQGGVLEHNVSVEVVTGHKRSSLGHLATMESLVRGHVPEVGEQAQRFCLLTLISAGALSTYVPPPPSLLVAYAQEPELASLHVSLRDALLLSLRSALLGVLPRA